MEQRNMATGRIRAIRPPCKAKPPQGRLPSLPPVLAIEVPARSAGSCICVAHPLEPGRQLDVLVPAGAKEGQRMLVRVAAEEPEELNPNAVPAEPLPAKVR